MKKHLLFFVCIALNLPSFAGNPGCKYWFPEPYIKWQFNSRNAFYMDSPARKSLYPIAFFKTCGQDVYISDYSGERLMKAKLIRQKKIGYFRVENVLDIISGTFREFENKTNGTYIYTDNSDNTLKLIITYKQGSLDTINFISSYKGYDFEHNSLTDLRLNFIGSYFIKTTEGAKPITINLNGTIENSKQWRYFNLKSIAYYKKGNEHVSSFMLNFIVNLHDAHGTIKSFLAINKYNEKTHKKRWELYEYKMDKGVPVISAKAFTLSGI